MHESRISMAMLALLAAPAVFAQDCVEAPFTEVYEHRGQVVSSAEVDGCAFDSTLTGDATSAATVHTVRRDVPESLRMFFRVDLSELDGIDAVQTVSLASAVSQSVVGTGNDANADMFRILVYGNLPGDARWLAFTAACSVCGNNMAIGTLLLQSDRPEIGIELDIGAGSDGELRVWIDTPFGEPPSSTLSGLDNAAWFGAYRLSLGLSSPTPAFASAQSGNTVRFDRFGIGDSQLVWRDFEPDGEVCSAPPLFTTIPVLGNTCGAEVLLPTLAAGSTNTQAPTHVYSLALPSPGWPGVLTLESESDLAAFVCWEFCGPAVRCVGAATPGNPLPLAGALPGEQRVVVTSRLPGICGEYTLGLNGPLE